MKQYIFVAGVDYIDIRSGGVDYSLFADRRAEWLANDNPGEDLRFHTFDFAEGTIVTDRAKSGQTDTSEVGTDDSHEPITESDYKFDLNVPYLVAKDKNTLSILDVYSRIQSIGQSDPGTLVELSMFSHGYWHGPVLVDSYDDRDWVFPTHPGTGPRSAFHRVPQGLRDPDDKDPRRKLDFSFPVMFSPERRQFRDAFANDGYVWLWGCSFDMSLNKLFSQLEDDDDYSVSGTSQTATITLQPDINSKYETFYKKNIDSSYSSGETDIQFGELRRELCLLNRDTYAVAIADTAQVTAYAAPFGTDALYDSATNYQASTPPDLLHVNDSMSHRVDFYVNHVDSMVDGPEDRNYVGFEPNYSCRPANPSGSP